MEMELEIELEIDEKILNVISKIVPNKNNAIIFFLSNIANNVEKNEENITINVYGNGGYVNEFLEIIYDNELEDYIRYCGETSNPKAEMNKYDAVVDFTLNHSFGMPYIEAVLNGKMLYCADNIAGKGPCSGQTFCRADRFPYGCRNRRSKYATKNGPAP